MWFGEWHLCELRKNWVGELVPELGIALMPRFHELGLFVGFCGGIFAADDDWRVPDLFAARREHEYGEGDGWARADLVVEVRSPGDDSYRKLPFYAERVREVLILHRDRTPELYRGMDRVEPDEDGSVRSQALDVTFAPIETPDGPRLRITWDGGTAEV